MSSLAACRAAHPVSNGVSLALDSLAPVDLPSLRSELLSLEKLIHELLHRQSQLNACLQVAGVGPADEPSGADVGAAPSTSWATVPRRASISIPLFIDSTGEEDADPCQLSNRFGPLQGLDENWPSLPRRAVSPSRSPFGSSARATAAKDSGAGVGAPSRRKRTSRGSKASNPPSPSPKRPRASLATSPSTPPRPAVSSPVASAASPSRLPPAANASSSANAGLHIPPPKYILIGDSIVRFVSIPNGITYSFSGAKVLDLVEYIPSITERHPSAHTVIVHAGTNDIRCSQSIKLRHDYESLATTIESLGKICIFSGLIPTLRPSSELFSRIYNIDQWLRNFCTACGLGFINHFDYFWMRKNLFKPDLLHPNNQGIAVMATNFSCHLSTCSD